VLLDPDIGEKAPGSRRLLFPALLLCLLLAATFFAYSPGLQGPFILDDEVNIKRAEVNTVSFTELQDKILSGRLGGFSRSVGMTSFALTQYFSGYAPGIFKYQNLMLHLANGMLILWLAMLLFRAMHREQEPSLAYWPAFLVAAIWLLHPLQVSTVLYSVQRLVMLSTFFSLLAGVFYIKGRLLFPNRPALGGLIVFVGLFVVWPIGILSKENALLLMPALVLVESLVLWPSMSSLRPARQTPSIAASLLLGLTIVVIAGVTIAEHASLLTGYAGREFNLWDRLLTQVHALWFYLGLIFFPVPSAMGIYHDGFPIQRVLDLGTALAAAGLAGIIIAGVMLRRKATLIALGILWFFCWHLIESTIIPLELVFEHRNYLALFGPALVVVALGQVLGRVAGLRRALLLGATALLLLLGLNTAGRSFSWSSYELIIVNEYARAPGSGRAIEGMFLLAKNKGNRAEAAVFLDQLKVAERDDAWPWVIDILEHCQEKEVPQALMETAVRLGGVGRVSPALISSLLNLDRTVYYGECPGLPADFVVQLVHAVSSNSRVHFKTAKTAALVLHALLSAREGEIERAQASLREALVLASSESPVRLREVASMVGTIASSIEDPEAAVRFVDETTAPVIDRLTRYQISVLIRPGEMSISPPET
jgi:protein O-mannosyl-transferase